MTDPRAEILEESEKTIGKLYELTQFFEDSSIMKIYLQTQVIHKLFEENSDIDINKLELYHIQFTTTLIDLLDKIKKRNERVVGMKDNELMLNNEMIAKLRKAINEEGGFDAEKQKQSERITRSIYALHKALSSQSTEYPFKDNLSAFSLKFYREYFYEFESSLLPEVTSYNNQDVYRNSFGTIGKTLLNDLMAKMYKVDFFAGAKVGNILMEIYKIKDMDKYMLFIPAKNSFLPCDLKVFPVEEWEDPSSKKENSIKDLMKKNLELERDIKRYQKLIDNDIKELLEENYNKIAELDFLADLENIDIQANTLRTMLETKMI
ncbi:MAG: hypothetical protein E6772_07970 [Dysgonomonas sp.]|nr:hypothetical protein [Dysgonomonas sp.]